MEASTFKVNVTNLPFKLRKSENRPRCSHCQNQGHEKHQCFELIGYPPNWQNQRSNRTGLTWNQGMSRNSGSGLREVSRANPNYGGNYNSAGGEEIGGAHYVFIGASSEVAGHGSFRRSFFFFFFFLIFTFASASFIHPHH